MGVLTAEPGAEPGEGILTAEPGAVPGAVVLSIDRNAVPGGYVLTAGSRTTVGSTGRSAEPGAELTGVLIQTTDPFAALFAATKGAWTSLRWKSRTLVWFVFSGRLPLGTTIGSMQPGGPGLVFCPELLVRRLGEY